MNSRLETMGRRAFFALACAAVAWNIESATAADVTWTGASGTTWSAGGNWDTGTAPGSSDIAVFNDPNAPAARVTGTTTIGGMQLDTTQSFSLAQKQQLKVTGPVTGTGGILITGDNAGTWTDSGRLELQNTSNPFGGDVEVSGGMIRFTSTATVNAKLFPGDILLNGGTFSFLPAEVPVNASGAPQTPGDRSFTNKLKVGAAGGRLHQNVGSGANNAAVVYDDIELGGPLAMASQGGGNTYGYTIDGTITILQDTERTTRISNETGHNGDDYISGPIVDGSGNAGNPLHLKVPGRCLHITGLSNTYTGGTIFEESGKNPAVIHPSATLGTGNVIAETGAHVLIQNLTPLGDPCSLASNATVYVRPGAAVGSGIAKITVTGSRTADSPVITFSGTASTVDMYVGQAVTGTGIPEGTTIESIDGHTQITLSQNATNTGSGNYTFAGQALDATSRFDANSAGVYGIDIATHTYDIDQSELGNGEMFVGTVKGGTYAGHFSPGNGNAIRVGGGESTDILADSGGNHLAITEENAFSGGSRVIVGAGSDVGGASRGYVVVSGDNDYTGGTIVNNGAALVIGKTGGTPFGTGHVFVRNGGILGASTPNGSFTDGNHQFTNYTLLPGANLLLSDQLPQSTRYTGPNGNEGRWDDSADMELADNTLYLHGGKNTTTTEKLGALRMSDVVRFRAAEGGGTSRLLLTFDEVSLSNGVFNSYATLGGNWRIRTPEGHEPEIVNGILDPHFIASSATFMTYDSSSDGNGTIGLKPFADYATLDAAAPDKVVRITSDTTLSTDLSVYALLTSKAIKGSGTTIAIGSGGLIVSAKIEIQPNLDFDAAEAVVEMTAAELKLSGAVQATNGFVKCGTGLAILNNANNDIRGRIFAAEGTLRTGNTAAAADWADCDLAISPYGTVDQNNKAVSVRSLSGSGTIQNGTVTVSDAFNPGGSRYPGTLTTGGLVLGPGCASTFRVGTESDAVKVNGDLTLDGTICAEIAEGFVPGTYPIMTYTGTLTNNGVRRGASDSGLSAKIDTQEPGVVKLVVEKQGKTIILFR